MVDPPQSNSAPAKPSPVFTGLERTINIAHRGGAALYPENTLFSFEAAISRHGCPMLETDVQLTADNEVVIFHDDTVDRTTDGTGKVSAHTWDDLRRLDAGYRFVPGPDEAPTYRGQGIGIPTLRETLRAFPEMRFNIELKSRDPAIVDAAVRIFRDEGATSRVVVGSEHDTVGAQLVRAYPEGTHFFPRDALVAWVMAVHNGRSPDGSGPYTVIDMPMTLQGYPLITPALVAEARRAGYWLNVWTIDEPGDMRQLIALGVDGIMTDRPDRLAEILG